MSFIVFSDKKHADSEYKIINNNAIAIFSQKKYYDYEHFRIELYDTDEKLLNRWDINQEVYYWDVSPDQKSVATIGTDSILNIYDQHGNLTIQQLNKGRCLSQEDGVSPKFKGFSLFLNKQFRILRGSLFIIQGWRYYFQIGPGF
jgi:hypothetical protein